MLSTKNNANTSFSNTLRRNNDWSQGQLVKKAGIDNQRTSKY